MVKLEFIEFYIWVVENFMVGVFWGSGLDLRRSEEVEWYFLKLGIII